MFIPKELHGADQLDLEDTMVIGDNIYDKAPQEWLVGDKYYLSTSAENVNFSLTTQLPWLLGSQPNAIFFTANSALPVADTVRGIYDTIGLNMPRLAWIDTKQELSPTPEEEIARLKRILDGGLSVVFIDQYFGSGKTGKLAHRLLQYAGAETITPIIGRWYHNADPEKVGTDFDNLSSTLAPLMYGIGEKVVAKAARS